jgi:hypothetical protein
LGGVVGGLLSKIVEVDHKPGVHGYGQRRDRPLTSGISPSSDPRTTARSGVLTKGRTSDRSDETTSVLVTSGISLSSVFWTAN